jgi:hypothetical protein
MEKITTMIKTVGKDVLNYVAKPIQRKQEDALLAIGKLLSRQQNFIDSNNINDYEFKIFSQRGEDGIIQCLIKHIPITNKVFIEFGVEDYMESNTRFLMMNDNWSGFVMDASDRNIKSIKKRDWFWKYDLKVQKAFIDKDNINDILTETNFKDIGLLSIDIDGNDYWIFEKINFTELNPAIIIVEYNALFGNERAISVPYDKNFNRTKAHFSNLFFGASLPALIYIAEKKGYSLIGCNDAGSNAFFVKKEFVEGITKIPKVDMQNAYKEDKCRQSRDKKYKFSFLSGAERNAIIKGLEVVNVISGEVELL